MLADKEAISAAAELIAQHMQPTPQICWPLLSARCRAEVWVKHENHTPIGAFKVRGGLIYMDALKRRTPDVPGVITATRPDGGYWSQRVREGRNEGWLRIGDETFAMQATEILGDARLPMLELWAPRAMRSARAIAQAAGETASRTDAAVGRPEPFRNPEVFFWTPR